MNSILRVLKKKTLLLQKQVTKEIVGSLNQDINQRLQMHNRLVLLLRKYKQEIISTCTEWLSAKLLPHIASQVRTKDYEFLYPEVVNTLDEIQHSLDAAIQAVILSSRRAVANPQVYKTGISPLLAKKSPETAVEESLTRKLVSYRTMSGRVFRTSFLHFVLLRLHHALATSRTTYTVLMGRKFGYTEVVVSVEPTSPESPCRPYLGRTFSISELNTKYSLLAELPNGGPPFHPWCRHSIRLVSNG